MKPFILLLATGFGVGYSPIAPGTLGSLLAIPIYYFLTDLPTPIYEIILLGYLFLSLWISGYAEMILGKKDDPRIVIDEMVGYQFSMLWISKKIPLILIGFSLFRFFDILKPFPIRHLERRLKGGMGVILDDVIAGIFVNILLHLIQRVIS